MADPKNGFNWGRPIMKFPGQYQSLDQFRIGQSGGIKAFPELRVQRSRVAAT